MQSKWLKTVGAADDPLADDWLVARKDLLDEIRFARNKRPSGISTRDVLVLYAATFERVFGLAEVLSDKPVFLEAPGEERWPWVMKVRLRLVVPRLSQAPHLDEIGVARTSVRQQSHIRLDDEQYRLAFEALTRGIQPSA